jgi:hypothetical protein
MAKLGFLLLMGTSMSVTAGGTGTKHQMDTVRRSIGVVTQIAFANDITSEKIKMKPSFGRYSDEGEIDAFVSIQVLASDKTDYLYKGEEAIQNYCKYLDLPDAYDRLSSVERNEYGRSEIITAKMIFDCPTGLLDWQKEYVKKNRSIWNRYLDRLYVSIGLIDNMKSNPWKTLATRKFKFKGGNHE